MGEYLGKELNLKKDGYLFAGLSGLEFPIARINADGSETFLTWDETMAWLDNYILEHPEQKEDLEKKKRIILERLEEVRLWMEKTHEEEDEHQKYLDSLEITEEEYQEREMKRLRYKKGIKYACRIGFAFFTIFLGLMTLAAFYPDESYHHCEAGQDDISPYWLVLITAVSFLAFCIVWNKTRNWPKDEVKKYKTKAEKEQEEFDLYFDIDKYLSGINWITIENENEIASQSGLYLFKSQGHDHIFFDLYELKEGEKLWKYYLEKRSGAKPIGFHVVEDDEKLKKCFINNWYVFDHTNI